MTESLFPLLATVVQDSTRLADIIQYSLNLLHPCIDPASPAVTSLTVRGLNSTQKARDSSHPAVDKPQKANPDSQKSLHVKKDHGFQGTEAGKNKNLRVPAQSSQLTEQKSRA